MDDNGGFDDASAREAADAAAERARRSEPPPPDAVQEFPAWRSPREGSANPTRLDSALWRWLVRTRWDAYGANQLLGGASSCAVGPMWSFDRFGKSETPLPDGRVVHIGGEHEDHYDPDFHIYNDVTVVAPDGAIALYGYPHEVFPPTDFHTATLVGNAIVVIGCLGHPGQRVPGTTPVYRLDLASMAFTPVVTRGEPPGWIHRHAAALSGDGRTITVSGGLRCLEGDGALCRNLDAWALDLATGTWRQETHHDWQHWLVRRTDRRGTRLWETRHEQWLREHATLGLGSIWRFDDAPDFEALGRLYRFDGDASAPVEAQDRTFTLAVDGIGLRFHEDAGRVEAIVEGRLTPQRLAEVQRSTLDLLSRLEAAPCELLEVAGSRVVLRDRTLQGAAGPAGE